MPHQNDWESRGVIQTFWGEVSAQEFVASVGEIAADPRFDDVRYIINDFSQVTGLDTNDGTWESIAIIRIGSAHTNPNVRVLVVSQGAIGDKLVTAMARPPLIGTQQTVNFSSLEAARKWLEGQPALGIPRGRR